MAIKAILFDLDGTLTDSGEGIINCAILALKHFGCPIPTPEQMRTFVGPPLHESFIKYGVPADKADEAVAVFRSRYIPIGKYENKPYPGIHDLLKKLKEDGHTLYVATSKPETMANDVLEHFELAHYFDCICGASMDTSRSTKEDVIAYLLELSGRDENILMVGDTKFDVIGAAAHGIPTIGVSWGYGKVEEMVEAGAKAIAWSMDELLSLLVC